MLNKLYCWWYREVWSNSKARDWYWKLEHIFNPAHRYHKMDTGLKPGYADPDIRIKFAVLEEVCSFFENTCDVISWIDKESGLDRSDIFWELLEIYEYWEWRKTWRGYFVDNDCDQLQNSNPDNILDHPREYFNCLDKLEKKEQEVFEKDKEMLHRAITILDYLWYP